MPGNNGPAAQPKQELLSQFGFASKVDPTFKLVGIDPEERLQVRSPDHVSPPETVRQYAMQMKEGATFPLPIVTRDKVIVDGNTRLAAMLLNQTSAASILVVDLDYKTATEEQQRKLLLFAAQVNQENGKRLNDRETLKAAKAGLRQGYTSAQLSKVLGASLSVISRARNEVMAEDTLSNYGFDISTVKRDSAFQAFGMKASTDLFPDLYKGMWELKMAANLTAEEINDLRRACAKATSEKAAKAIIATAKKDLDERIKNHATTGNGQPAPARALRRSLGAIVKYEGNEAALVETNAASIASYVTALTKAAAVLQTVLALQKAKAS